MGLLAIAIVNVACAGNWSHSEIALHLKNTLRDDAMANFGIKTFGLQNDKAHIYRRYLVKLSKEDQIINYMSRKIEDLSSSSDPLFINQVFFYYCSDLTYEGLEKASYQELDKFFHRATIMAAINSKNIDLENRSTRNLYQDINRAMKFFQYASVEQLTEALDQDLRLLRLAVDEKKHPIKLTNKESSIATKFLRAASIQAIKSLPDYRQKAILESLAAPAGKSIDLSDYFMNFHHEVMKLSMPTREYAIRYFLIKSSRTKN